VGGNRNERRLANSDQRVPNQQLAVGMRDRREKREPAPEDSTEYDDEFAEYRSASGPTKGAATM